MKLLALIAIVAAADEKKKEAAKEGGKCVMGKDECGYEADKKLICAQVDYSGYKATDAQKKALKTSAKLADDAAVDKAIEKMIADRKVDGDNGNCGKAEECDKPSKEVQEYVDAGVAITCSAKALAVSMGAILAAAATL